MPEETNIEARLRADDARMQAMEARLAGLETEVAGLRDEQRENTDLTREIRDLLTAVRVGLRVLGGLGALAKWAGMLAGGAVAVWSAWQAFTHGGSWPPKP